MWCKFTPENHINIYKTSLSISTLHRDIFKAGAFSHFEHCWEVNLGPLFHHIAIFPNCHNSLINCESFANLEPLSHFFAVYGASAEQMIRPWNNGSASLGQTPEEVTIDITLIRVFFGLLCKHTCVFLFASFGTTRNSQGYWGHGLGVFLMILCCVTFKRHAIIWQYHSQQSHQQLSLPQNISCGKSTAGETWKGWHGMSVNWMPGRPLLWKNNILKKKVGEKKSGNNS